jgi:hypothetical protein
LITKVQNFRKWLLDNHSLSVKIIDLDDGIAILKLK